MKSARAKSQAEPLDKLGPPTIGFRLDDENRRLLCDSAERAHMTPHEFARNVLIDALRQPERLSAIEEMMLQLAEQVHDVRADLAVVTQGLLVAAGGMSQADAKLWVTNYLKPE